MVVLNTRDNFLLELSVKPMRKNGADVLSQQVCQVKYVEIQMVGHVCIDYMTRSVLQRKRTRHIHSQRKIMLKVRQLKVQYQIYQLY